MDASYDKLSRKSSNRVQRITSRRHTMRLAKGSMIRSLITVAVAIVAIFLSSAAKAQNGHQGLNAVYGPGGAIQASAAFIDAKPYLGTGDICAALNTVILDVAGVGAVVDA